MGITEEFGERDMEKKVKKKRKTVKGEKGERKDEGNRERETGE